MEVPAIKLQMKKLVFFFSFVIKQLDSCIDIVLWMFFLFKKLSIKA